MSEKRPFSVFPTRMAPREFTFQADFAHGDVTYVWNFFRENGRFLASIQPSSGQFSDPCATVVYAFPWDGVFRVKLISKYDGGQVVVERIAEVDSSRGLVGYSDAPDGARCRMDENLREVFG